MKLKENLEEEVTKKHVLIENTSSDLVSTIVENQALVEGTRDNIVSMSHTIST